MVWLLILRVASAFLVWRHSRGRHRGSISMARTDSVACVGLHHSFRTVGQACGIPSVWPCNLGSHAFVGFVGMVHEIQCGFVTRSNPSSRELRRPCIWSLARCALGLRRFGPLHRPLPRSGIWSRVERSALSLALCGAAVRATLAVPSLETRSGISSTFTKKWRFGVGGSAEAVFSGSMGQVWASVDRER